MRNFLSSILFLFVFNIPVLEAQTLYAPSSIEKETLQDFIFLLNKATGQSWQLKASEKPLKAGIFLQTGTDKTFTTKESFQIESNGRDQLIITSSSVEGLVFGFYKHLRNLGFKFYEPDELYSVYPKLQHPYGEKQKKNRQTIFTGPDFFWNRRIWFRPTGSGIESKKSLGSLETSQWLWCFLPVGRT
jgi:hypothetical protein